MAKPKSVTINLTAKQRQQLRSQFGVEHTQIKVEGTKSALSAKVAPRTLSANANQLAVRTAPRTLSTSGGPLSVKSAPRTLSTSGGPLSVKSTPRTFSRS